MLYGTIPGLAKQISRLVLGTVSFTDEQQALADELLDAFVAAGGTAIDTAHSYGSGASERAVGAWLRRHNRPDDLTIITKGGHPRPDEPRRVTPAAIAADLAESRERLGLASIDLYLLHRDDEAVPVGTIVAALNEHVAHGHVRALGASNWSPARIAAANAYAADHGLAGFVASSPNLALAVPSEPMWPGCRSIAGDAAALDWYRRQQMPVFAWSASASGFFSGRFTPDVPDDPNMVRVYYRDDNWQRLERARALARRLDCTPTQVALAWVLHQPLPTFAIVGPRRLAELDDCLGALRLRLTPADVAWLNLEPEAHGPESDQPGRPAPLSSPPAQPESAPATGSDTG